MTNHPAIKSVAFTPTGQTAADLEAIRAKKAAAVERMPAWLAKMRKRDDDLDRGSWRSAAEIGRCLGLNSKEAATALQALADAGTIEKMTFTNGIGWRAPSVWVKPAPIRLLDMRTTNARSLLAFLQMVASHCSSRNVRFGDVIIQSDLAPAEDACEAALWLEVRDDRKPIYIVRLT